MIVLQQRQYTLPVVAPQAALFDPAGSGGGGVMFLDPRRPSDCADLFKG
jgi:hypothetical protein